MSASAHLRSALAPGRILEPTAVALVAIVRRVGGTILRNVDLRPDPELRARLERLQQDARGRLEELRAGGEWGVERLQA